MCWLRLTVDVDCTYKRKEPSIIHFVIRLTKNDLFLCSRGEGFVPIFFYLIKDSLRAMAISSISTYCE